MSYTTGIGKYSYKVRVNLEDIGRAIMKELEAKKLARFSGWDIEDDELIIDVTARGRYKHWHCRATMLDPAEDEWELTKSVNEDEVAQVVRDTIRGLTDYRCEVEIDEESIEPDDPEGDWL